MAPHGDGLLSTQKRRAERAGILAMVFRSNSVELAMGVKIQARRSDERISRRTALYT